MSRLLIYLVKVYQYAISPMMGTHCRFTPTCSQYAVEAITKYGAARGFWLSMRRLSRCHPRNPGGYDPVP
ncbi:MAG TPA: membrane protein insertion efficiency factor YidD [Sulfuriferula sp.]|nr:membrane protein insertion efficiency factor YidD [Sulfuriferula sp.]